MKFLNDPLEKKNYGATIGSYLGEWGVHLGFHAEYYELAIWHQIKKNKMDTWHKIRLKL